MPRGKKASPKVRATKKEQPAIAKGRRIDPKVREKIVQWMKKNSSGARNPNAAATAVQVEVPESQNISKQTLIKLAKDAGIASRSRGNGNVEKPVKAKGTRGSSNQSKTERNKVTAGDKAKRFRDSRVDTLVNREARIFQLQDELNN